LIPAKPDLGRSKSGVHSLRNASKKAEDSDDDEYDEDDKNDEDDDDYDEDDKKGSNDKKSTSQTRAKTKTKTKRTSADDSLSPSKPELGRSASGGHSLRHAQKQEKQKKQSKLGRSLSGMHSVRLQEHDGKPNLPKEVLKSEATSYNARDVLVVRTPEVSASVRHKKKKISIDGFYLCVVQAGKKPKNGLKVKWLSSKDNRELDSTNNDPWFNFQETEAVDKIAQDTILCVAKAEHEDKGYKISVYERKRILKLLLEEHLSDVEEGANVKEDEDADA